MISHDNGRLFETNGFRAMLRSAKRAFPSDVRRGLRRAQRAASYLLRRLFGTITHVRTNEPAVALTFDDGPNPLATPQILEMLELYKARGTFFVLGQCAQA